MRKYYTVSLLLFLCLLVFLPLVSKSVFGQGLLPISINSPVLNAIYSSSDSLTLDFSIQCFSNPTGTVTITYFIDGQNQGALPFTVKSIPAGQQIVYPDGVTRIQYIINYNQVLPNLPAGRHSLTIYANYLDSQNNNIVDQSTVNFTITNTVKPTLIPVTPTPSASPTMQGTNSPKTTQITDNSFTGQAMLLSSVIAGAVIVAIALVVVYRKHSLKLKVNGDSIGKET
jgi:hypothetical protein